MTLTEEEKKAVLHFISSSSLIPDDKLQALARSVTKGRIRPVERELCVKNVIMHVESLIDVIYSKKLGLSTFVQYLKGLNVPVSNSTNREEVTHTILYSIWKYPAPLKDTSLSEQARIDLRSEWKFPDLPPIPDNFLNDESAQNKSSSECDSRQGTALQDNPRNSTSDQNGLGLKQNLSQWSCLQNIFPSTPNQNKCSDQYLPQPTPLRDNFTNVPGQNL